MIIWVMDGWMDLSSLVMCLLMHVMDISREINHFTFPIIMQFKFGAEKDIPLIYLIYLVGSGYT